MLGFRPNLRLLLMDLNRKESDMSDNNPVWWEKTVEYQFVINNHREFQFVTPLDGNHEKQTSDTILGKDNKFILIEFKRDGNSQTAEFNKFKKVVKEKSDDDILEEIESIKNHQCHFIVYAELNKEENKEENKLELFHKEYLSYLKNSGEHIKYNEMIKNGISLKEFIEYLREFGQLRVQDTGSNDEDSSGGTRSGGVSKAPKRNTTDFSNILILDNNGGCYTFNDIKELQKLQLQIKLKKTTKNKFGK